MACNISYVDILGGEWKLVCYRKLSQGIWFLPRLEELYHSRIVQGENAFSFDRNALLQFLKWRIWTHSHLPRPKVYLKHAEDVSLLWACDWSGFWKRSIYYRNHRVAFVSREVQSTNSLNLKLWWENLSFKDTMVWPSFLTLRNFMIPLGNTVFWKTFTLQASGGRLPKFISSFLNDRHFSLELSYLTNLNRKWASFKGVYFL